MPACRPWAAPVSALLKVPRRGYHVGKLASRSVSWRMSFDALRGTEPESGPQSSRPTSQPVQKSLVDSTWPRLKYSQGQGTHYLAREPIPCLSSDCESNLTVDWDLVPHIDPGASSGAPENRPTQPAPGGALSVFEGASQVPRVFSADYTTPVSSTLFCGTRKGDAWGHPRTP